MPSHTTYGLAWVSLTLVMGYLFMALQQSVTLLLTLDEGYLLTATPPDLERGIAPLGPPVPTQPQLLGCGVAPLSQIVYKTQDKDSSKLPRSSKTRNV